MTQTVHQQAVKTRSRKPAQRITKNIISKRYNQQDNTAKNPNL
jgi:hypothetical protein